MATEVLGKKTLPTVPWYKEGGLSINLSRVPLWSIASGSRIEGKQKGLFAAIFTIKLLDNMQFPID